MNGAKDRLIIAIDPDVDKNGVAILHREDGDPYLDLRSLNLADLVRFLFIARDVHPVLVVEAGWMNRKKSWHTSYRDSANVAARKGYDVGRNHQTGYDIISVCRGFGIDVVEQAPLRKCWRGKDGKITHDELSYFAKCKARTNQEERDAGLLAWCYGNLPIRVKPIGRKC